MGKKSYEVAIVGGGPAGLSAALTLGRARRTALVIDRESPRNKTVHRTHGYLTQDGLSPDSFRELAHKEISRYPTVDYLRDEVIDVHKQDGAFALVTHTGETYASKKLLFAAGLIDILPDIDGLNDIYGKSAFICPYCDGWEFRDRPIAIIGKKLSDIHFAKALHGWSSDVALFTNGPHQLELSQIQAFNKRNIPIYDKRIQRLEHQAGNLNAIILEDGKAIRRQAVFFNPETRQSSLIPKQLGVSVNKFGIYETKENGRTDVEGLYIAGDSRNHLHQIIHAASDGAKAAVSINMELLKEDWQRYSEKE